MTEQSIHNNPAILKRLYRRFDHLQDYPCELKGQFIDEACHIWTLETDDFLGFILGYPVEKDSAGRDRFTMLSAEENQAITHYRHLRPVLPWRPQPIIGVQMPQQGPGTVTGTHSIPVVLKNVGNAQLWWGGEVAVLWEAFFDDAITQRQDYEALINQLWGCCETFLENQGVQRIYTYNRDLRFNEKWYRTFLERRGYRVVEGRKVTVVKNIE